MPALQSTSLSFAEYDEDSETLTITFSNGRSYDYSPVPRQVYDELLAAPSAGTYYATRIKGIYS